MTAPILKSTLKAGMVSTGGTSIANTITVEITNNTTLTVKAGTFTEPDGTARVLSSDKIITLSSSLTSTVQHFGWLVLDGSGNVDLRVVKYYTLLTDQASNSDSIPAYTKLLALMVWCDVPALETSFNNLTDIFYFSVV